MSILINKNTNVLIQGITGKEGSFHTEIMLSYGTKIAAGVTPEKGGNRVSGIPVYNSVKEAMKEHGIDASGVFVPPPFAFSAAREALEAGIRLLILITEGIPVHDTMKIISLAKRNRARVIGPNTPGILTAGEAKIGILATEYIKKGKIGVISRSGTLTVEICQNLIKYGFGQSTVIGIGGDPVVGSSFVDLIKMFERDPETEGIVIVGEVGGTMEEETADYLSSVASVKRKPVVAFIAGQNVPEGKRFGHAGAIIEGNKGTAKSKIKALKNAGVPVARVPWEVGPLLQTQLGTVPNNKKKRTP